MNSKIKPIIETSIMIALAVVLELLSTFLQSVIPFLNAAWLQGGTVTLAMLPIALIAYRHGLEYGLISGLCFGILNFLIGGAVIYHWGSVIFDYILAFTAWGLVGIFKKKNESKLFFILGILIAGVVRYACHTISGVLFFSEFAGDLAIWIYSLVYNLGYNVMTVALTIIIGIPLHQLFFVNKVLDK